MSRFEKDEGWIVIKNVEITISNHSWCAKRCRQASYCFVVLFIVTRRLGVKGCWDVQYGINTLKNGISSRT